MSTTQESSAEQRPQRGSRALLAAASFVIVVAGMEGALASVVGGIVPGVVIAVPTSTGYGTGFGGLAALLSMLNSCAPGVLVTNIDNGYGAGVAAARINSLSEPDAGWELPVADQDAGSVRSDGEVERP